MALVESLIDRFQPELDEVMLASSTAQMVVQRVAGAVARQCNTQAKNLLEAIDSNEWEMRTMVCLFREARANAKQDSFRGVVHAMIPLVTDKFLFQQIEEKIVQPLTRKVSTWINTATGWLMSQVTALCGLIPVAGGVICAQVVSVIQAGMNWVVPNLANFASTVAWKLAKQKLSSTINRALTNFADEVIEDVTESAVGQAAGNFMADAKSVDAQVKPWVELLTPLLESMMKTIAPEAMAKLAQCEMYLNKLHAVVLIKEPCAPPPPPPPPRPPALHFSDAFYQQAWHEKEKPEDQRHMDPEHAKTLIREGEENMEPRNESEARMEQLQETFGQALLPEIGPRRT